MMKLSKLQLSFASSLVCVLSISASSASALTPEILGVVAIADRPHRVAQTPARAAFSGTFVAAEHPTSGTARIVSENGQRFLVLDGAFKTDQGPDLHVILDPSAKPPMKYENLTRYVNLGRLQKVNGEQRYPIPATVELSKFKSVAVWCRMANATFGYAPLNPVGNASVR